MTDNIGPEPTGWELMRGLTEVKDAIARVGDKVVQVDVYTADKQGTTERFVRVESRIRDIETNNIDSEKLKRSQRLTISLAVASPFIAILAGIVFKGLLP